MNVPKRFTSLTGQWTGTNQLWLSPKESASESVTTADVGLAAQGRFVKLQYTWTYEGEPQDGLLLLGFEPSENNVNAVWIDSWHMQDKFMLCEGEIGSRGEASVTGSYAAPTGPDWGWRITIEAKSYDEFELTMHNLSPEGQEQLAVKAVYTREI